nr:MAG TPA: Protein of unknown function (DUF2612) [Caudoviricetes sp.]
MEFVDNYLKLITGEHRNKPKYMSMLRAVLSYSTDIFALGIDLDDYFDLDYANGVQEDVLGDIVGTSRTLEWQPELKLSPVLDNANFRIVLMAKISKNMWKGGIQDLGTAWKILFSTPILIEDNQDMTIDVVIISNGIDKLTQLMIRNGDIIPKPQSVLVNAYFANNNVFGYDIENDVIAGYDKGNWIEQGDEMSFAYDTDTPRLSGYDSGMWG